MELTLAEAAKSVKRTKQALAVAIQKGRISASKDANGQWRIDAAELFRVYPSAKEDVGDARRHLDILPPSENTEIRELQTRISALEELRRTEHARAEELREERDAWRRQCEALMRALPPGKTPEQPAEAQNNVQSKERPWWRFW